MPVYEEVPMADCVKCGLGLGTEDLSQGITASSPVFSDIFREMQDLKVLNSRPSQNEENRTFSHSQEEFSLIDNQDIKAEPEEAVVEDFSNECKSLIEKDDNPCAENTEVPSNESFICFLPVNYNKRNPWRRLSGFHVSGSELRSATYPARSSVQKLRFAQAKKPLSYLYSYFSVDISDCDDQSGITIGLCRKDYPSKVAPGITAGSIGYCADTGSIFIRNSVHLDGLKFSKGDVIGCGIIYPSHYKPYADLSTDDNSDGMTDVVLTSLLNKKSMHFVCNALNLNAQRTESSDCNSKPSDSREENGESDYYNENFVESRTPVEVYFTYNMQVLGKVMSHIPIGGFYPTLHIYSCSPIKMNVDLNPPAS